MYSDPSSPVGLRRARDRLSAETEVVITQGGRGRERATNKVGGRRSGSWSGCSAHELHCSRLPRAYGSPDPAAVVM